MQREAVSYTLVVVSLAGLAVLLSGTVSLAGALISAVRPSRRRPDSARGEAVRRRCATCERSWWAEPGVHVGRFRLRVMRSVRRLCRRRDWPVPEWAERQGWARCPSCLSTRVRTSGSELPQLRRPFRVLVLAGGASCLGGLLLLSLAALGARAASG